MIDLVRKRHEGDGWQVFSEIANGTGYKVRGWADAAALGIWPSRGHELHGYEFKISREDLKKELRDPAKADNVGKYCDFWWLVVATEDLTAGLVIPETWGILVPQTRGSSKILRVVRKAPKQDAKPFDRAFCAAMIRNVIKTWVPKHEHEELKKTALEKARQEAKSEKANQRDDFEEEFEQLKVRVASFERETGLEIANVADWRAKDIAAAVKTVVQAREIAGQHRSHTDAAQMVRGEIAHLERAAQMHELAAGNAKAAAERVRSLLVTSE